MIALSLRATFGHGLRHSAPTATIQPPAAAVARSYYAVIRINEMEEPVCEQLHNFRTAQQFVDFANQRGADVVRCNKGTTKVSMAHVTSVFWQMGQDGELTHQDHQAWVNALKAAGIAWD